MTDDIDIPTPSCFELQQIVNAYVSAHVTKQPPIDDLTLLVAMSLPRNAIDYALAHQGANFGNTDEDAMIFLRKWARTPTSTTLLGYRAWLSAKLQCERHRG